VSRGETTRSELGLRVLEDAPVVILVLDREGKIEHVNPFCERLTGYRLEELRGKDWFDAFVPDGVREATRARFAESVAGAHVSGHVNAVVTRSGEERLVEWTDEFLRDERGEPVAVLAIGQDITARRALEESVRIKEAAIAAASTGIAISDAAGLIFYVNRAFLDLWGLASEAEAIGRSALSFWQEPAAVEEVVAALHSGRPWRGDLLARRSDGSPAAFEVVAHAVRNEAGAVTAMMASFLDVSERRRTEQMLRQSEARLAEAHRLAALGAWEVDLTTQTSWWSPQQYVLIGIAPGTPVTQQLFLGLVHPDDRASFEELFRRVLAEGSGEGDYRIVRPDGQVRHMHGVASVTRDAAGRPRVMSGTNQDVTARVLADEARRRALEEKETLLREIHHRVKNNLQIISSLVHFQAKKLRSEDAAALAELRRRIQAMSLVHERLYQAEDVGRVDLAGYVRALVAELSQSLAAGRDVRISVVADTLQVPIESALPVGMIVCELVTNVLKYAFPDGRKGAATVSVRGEGERVVLDVDDDGVGLPEDREPARGASFGWDLVRTLTTQLDGTLSVGGGPGAHVRITFPAPGA